MAKAQTPNPRRGEIWLVDFDPSVGAEIQKLRPALVVNVDSVGRLPLRLVVPITDWKTAFHASSWLVRLPASNSNGLHKDSCADAFQCKSASINRFSRKIGAVTPTELRKIASAIALCVGAP